MAAREQMSIGSYRQHMVEQLFSAMLSVRLGEISQAPNAPFLRAQADRDLFVRSIEVTSLDALVAKGSVERGLSALFTELARVERFGFTAPELARMKLNLQRGLERAVVEKDKSPSGPLADEFIRNFIQDEPIPGIVYQYRLEPAIPAGNHAGRSERGGQRLYAGPQSSGGHFGTGGRQADLAQRRQARRSDQRHRCRAPDGIGGHGEQSTAARTCPHGWFGCRDNDH